MLNRNNLYEEMDRKRNDKNRIRMEEQRKRQKESKLLSVSIELTKVFLVILVICLGFIATHRGNLIQEAKDYFENFQNPNYTNRGKPPIRYNRDVILEKEEAQTLIPVIDIQGQLTRDGEKFVIFNHDEISYTKTTGDSFAKGKYRIGEINDKELEITDGYGNYFYYDMPQR